MRAVSMVRKTWRRWVDQLLLRIGTARAEAELRAMDDRELRDLGLGRCGIDYAARHGREREAMPGVDTPDTLQPG